MRTPEPSIRIIVGKKTDGGEVVTALVNLTQLTDLTAKGWSFVAADPEDLSEYLAWLYQREIDT